MKNRDLPIGPLIATDVGEKMDVATPTCRTLGGTMTAIEKTPMPAVEWSPLKRPPAVGRKGI
jgi:hypothetical protein